MHPAVSWIDIGDDATSWAGAGFAVSGTECIVGGIGVRFVGRADGTGIRGWSWTGLPDAGPMDGLPTGVAPAVTAAPGAHPNGVTIVDHVVVVTPDLERTVPAFESRGLEVRRVRHTDQYGPPFRQVFFRGGETIVELIGPDEANPDDGRAAHLYGLAFTVADLDATARFFGEHLSTPKAAVQPGRRIATLRHRAFDISVPIALMSA